MTSKARQIADYVIGLFTDRTNGRVGIGTQTPEAKLEIHTDVDGVANVLDVTNFASSSSAGAEAVIRLGRTTVANRRVAIKSIAGATNSNNVSLAFDTDETERMRITSAGNVGIGTSSPAERLHVVGNSRVTDKQEIRNSNFFSYAISLGSGQKINIPFTSQGNLNVVHLIEAVFLNNASNNFLNRGGRVLFSVSSLNLLRELIVLESSGGAYSSIAISGMNVVITKDGVAPTLLKLNIISNGPGVVQVENINAS